jgi:hypothetical protein
MALIQYEVHYENGSPKVTHCVLEVDKGDRIQFTSDIPNTAIEYIKGTPFGGSKAPQADQLFPLETQGVTGPFTVDKTLTDAKRIKFNCGLKPDNGPFERFDIGCGTPPPRIY